MQNEKVNWSKQELEAANPRTDLDETALQEVKLSISDAEAETMLQAAYPENAMEMLIDDISKGEVQEAFNELRKAYHFVTGISYAFEGIETLHIVPEELEKLFKAKIQDAEKAKRILGRALLELAECMQKHGINPNK